MIGLVIISIFTATVTTSLTAISLSNEIKLYGSDVSSADDTLICCKYVVYCDVPCHKSYLLIFFVRLSLSKTRKNKDLVYETTLKFTVNLLYCYFKKIKIAINAREGH